MGLDKFLKLYQSSIFDRPVTFYLKVKTDRGFGYSSFDEIDKSLYPYFNVESFEIPTVSYGLFTTNGKKEEYKIELHIKINIKKQYDSYIWGLIMTSKAHKITNSHK